MNEGLIEMIADVMGLDETEVTGSLSREVDACWDSMNHLRLITTLEEQYSIHLTMDEIQGIVTLDDVDRIISNYLSAA